MTKRAIKIRNEKAIEGPGSARQGVSGRRLIDFGARRGAVTFQPAGTLVGQNWSRVIENVSGRPGGAVPASGCTHLTRARRTRRHEPGASVSLPRSYRMPE